MKKKIVITFMLFIIIFVTLSCSGSSVSRLLATDTATPTETFTPTNTATPKPTRTPKPTYTPTFTATPIEGLVGPEGWDRISSENVILFMPREYVGGKMIDGDYGIDAMVDVMSDLLRVINGTDAELDTVLELWGLDLDSPDASSSFVVLTSDNSHHVFDMESTGEDLGRLLEMSSVYDIEHELVELDHTTAYLVRIYDESTPMMAKYYFAEQGDKFFMIMFTTLTNDYEEIEQDFDQIVKSIYFIE